VDELLQELLDLGQFAERTELSKLGDELAWIERVDWALRFELRRQQRQKRGGQVLPGIAGRGSGGWLGRSLTGRVEGLQ
jgi:hypothetical protein